MSDAGSDNEADSGRSASAPVALSYAALRQQNLEPLIADRAWYTSNESGFLHTVAGQYRFSHGSDGVPRSFKGPDSDTMSLAMTAYSHSTAGGSFGSSAYSAHPPSLGHYQSTVTSSSPRTSNADDFLQLTLIDQSNDGVPEEVPSPRQGALPCAYSFLACRFSSDNLEQWKTHCESHFYGQLPKSVHCPFKCNWSRISATGEEAWKDRNAHIDVAHWQGDAIDEHRRADSSLIDHLWRTRIIDDAQMKELRKHGHLENNIIFLRSAGRERDRRRDRRRGG